MTLCPASAGHTTGVMLSPPASALTVPAEGTLRLWGAGICPRSPAQDWDPGCLTLPLASPEVHVTHDLATGGEEHVPLALDPSGPCAYPLTPEGELPPKISPEYGYYEPGLHTKLNLPPEPTSPMASPWAGQALCPCWPGEAGQSLSSASPGLSTLHTLAAAPPCWDI